MRKERQRWIMHLDMDAFFAAVEQRDFPEYRDKPVIVGARPGDRGVVATCSYEARRYGIRSAMPISEAYRRCPQALFLRPDPIRYTTASKEIFAALREISPVVEPVSIDEAYVDISGLQRLYGDVVRIGEITKERIGAKVGLSCSVGIGPNRLIAKLASEHRKPDGLVVVSPTEIREFLDPMPVSNLRGVGKSSLKVLQRLGIRRIWELRRYSPEQLQSLFGERGAMHLYEQARGLASDRVGDERVRKSISKETTFNIDVENRRRLRNVLRHLSAEVGRTARSEAMRGRTVTLKIRLDGFETHTRRCRVEPPLDGDMEIFKQAWRLYERSGFAGRPVRLIGVGLTDWETETPMGDLFAQDKECLRRQRLYRTLDEVKERFGRGIISIGMGDE